MRRRSVAAELGVHPQAGLYSVLAGQADFASTAVAVEKNFWFLDVEPHIPNPPEIIASKRFRRFVEQAKEKFNFVIFDTPPLAAFVDAAVLSSIADGTVMVVRENFAKRSEVQDAYAQLQNAGANVVGVCMNFCHEERSEYYYAYYDKQGNRVRTSGADTEEDDENDKFIPLPSRQSAPAAQPAQETAMPVNRTRPAVRNRFKTDPEDL